MSPATVAGSPGNRGLSVRLPTSMLTRVRHTLPLFAVVNSSEKYEKETWLKGRWLRPRL